jgi:hypothetical protein
VEFNKSYTNRVSEIGKNYNAVLIRHPNCRTKRTYGWDCPNCDYSSNRHYNTQRHIDSIHGIGSGEPVDHRTGETREEKRGAAAAPAAADDNPNQSNNMVVYPRPHPQPLTNNPINYPDPVSPIRMPFLEAQERRVRELGYTAQNPSLDLGLGPPPTPTQLPPHDYRPHTRGAGNAAQYQKNLQTQPIENPINHYSANIYSPNSTNPTIGFVGGPLDDLIRALLYYSNLRRSFR